MSTPSPEPQPTRPGATSPPSYSSTARTPSGTDPASRVGAAAGGDLNLQARIANQQFGSVAAGEPQVFMGYETQRLMAQRTTTPGELPGVPYIRRKENVKTVNQAINLIYTDPQMRDLIANRLVAAGVLQEDYNDDQLYTAWSQYVNRASDIYMAGKTGVTPFDLVELAGKAPGADGNLSPKTVVQKQVMISTPEEARAILRTTLSNALGRWPSETELDEFQAQLNSAQRENPSVTTTKYDPSGRRTSSVTRGGLDTSSYAEEYAQREFGAEADDYQLVAENFPALIQALASPV